MVYRQRVLCFEDTREPVSEVWNTRPVDYARGKSFLHRSEDSCRSSFAASVCANERDRESRFGSVFRRQGVERMRSDLCGGHGTRRFLGSVAVNSDGDLLDMPLLRQHWNSEKEIIDICVAHNVTIPLLYRIVKKFSGFDARSFSGGDGTGSRMDEIPEAELIELVKIRSEAIRKTWTPAIERSRRARHSLFFE